MLAVDEPLGRALERAGVGVWEADLRSGSLELSARLAEWLGFPPGRSARIDDWRARVHPEDRDQFDAAWKKLVDGGDYEVTCRIVEHGGGVWWLTARGVVVRGADGAPVRAVGVAVDATARAFGEAAQSRLGAIVESSDDAIVGKTLDGIVTSWNQAAERLFGYTAEEMIGQSISRIMPPDRPDDFAKILSAIRRGERVDHYETDRIRKDGRRVHVSLTVSPIKDAAGRITGASKIARDVTDRKRAEQLVQLAETRLAAIVDSATDAIVTLDANRRILIFNAAAERMFGCHASEALGQPLDRFIPAESRERHDTFIREFAATGVSARSMGRDRILSAVRADGSVFPMEAQISQVVVGGQRLFTAVLRDVTERQHADETRAHLAAIVESSDDAIISKTLEGIVTTWNKAAERMFGYSAAEMIGQSVRRIAPPDRRDEMPRILAAIRHGERVDHYETERMRKDGSRIYVSLTVSPIKDATGRIIGASKIARDVTDRKQAERERERLLAETDRARAEAEAANRAKDEFLSMVSHELRTPLASILGWIGVLRQGKLSPERSARALDTIARAGRMQSELIDDLLDVSRIVTGRLRLSLEALELRPVVEAAVDAIRPDAAEKGITLAVELADAVRLVGDPTRLQQVVGNVLNNAVKFTPAGGRVEVRLTCTGDEARIVVRDSGAGIAPDFLPYVFQPFRQATDVKSRKTGGLGIGLAIVQTLVNRHRGTVTAESAGENAGATFTISLPIHADVSELPVNDHARPLRPGVPRLDGIRVLVVDDEAEARDALRAMLEASGATVAASPSVEAARATLAEWDPDVLVSDIKMPDEDGYALLREVRATERLRGLPAIAVTAYEADEVCRHAAAAGFQACLGKPIQPEALIALLASVARVGRD